MLGGIVMCCGNGRILINIIDAAYAKASSKMLSLNSVFTADRLNWWEIYAPFN
jgi:hypothetical protein